MLKNRKHDHIGLGSRDVEADSKWYQEVLGFQLVGAFPTPDGGIVHFLQNQDVTFEVYSQDVPDALVGKIDHYSFQSNDIEADYAYAVAQGYTITTNGIEGIPTFWENGVRFFKIQSPTGEQFEFCQKL